MLENGLEKCTCKKSSCERFGNCAACIEHHKNHKRYPPYCKREGRNQKNRSKEEKSAK